MKKVLSSLRSDKDLRGLGCKLGFVFTDDRTIAELAGRYRSSPRPTDVLAFDYGSEAEIVISVDTAKRQARERGVPLSHELVLLALHGALHIAGYDDGRRADWLKMKRREFEKVIRIL